MNKPSISFFCPAYNDEGSLPVLIPKTVRLLEKVCASYEIVIIDDASPDNTGKVADLLAKKYPYVSVIHHKKNRGYGGALKSGFRHAKKYPYVFYTDGDSQYDVNVLKQMLVYIDEYDAIVGCRRMRELTWQRKFQSTCYNKLIRFLFGINSRDVNCAIRLINRKSVNKLNLSSKSAFLPAEMLIKLHEQGARVKELLVIHYPRTTGQASGGKLSVIIPTFIEMLTYYFHRKKVEKAN
ncbi:MAG TPA: glycosyltransferase family 2 protein [Candidatus Saccharimonadales bacterium]|nr:glycosyltransferase family 2 protein [Candidatus Saccharimonadales bacterium]